jgi:hypothetical protein
MASGWFTEGLKKLVDGSIDIDTSTIKVMLVKAAYTYDPDHDQVSDISGNEIAATNYTSGYGGAGRKTASVTLQNTTASNRLDIAIGDLTWTSLGGASNDTVAAAVVIFETGGADTSSIPLAYLDITDTPTNGGNFTLDFAALASGGNLQIAV